MSAARNHQRLNRSSRLIRAVEPFARVAVVMHDNPDPDAIAAGWAMKFLLDERTDKDVRLVGGGDILRAENRQMVKLLRPPLQLVDDFRPGPETAVILIDCGPEATNHLMSEEAVLPVAVVDHHDPQADLDVPVKDIRPNVAASATIATAYLRQQKLEPGSRLATGLVYAVRTETRGFATHHSRLDRAVLPWLMRRADPTLLAEIENAPLAPEYFSDLVLALQNTFVYQDAGFCMLPAAAGPEIIGEVADLLIRCDGLRRVLCAAIYEKHVLLSVRTDKAGGNATQLLLEAIRGLGRGGGHEHRAGGKLLSAVGGAKVPEDVQDTLRKRWLAACGINRLRGTRLVPKREIVENL